jgi:hypothetical protein
MDWLLVGAALLVAWLVFRPRRRRGVGGKADARAHEIGTAAELRVVDALKARGVQVIHDIYLPLGAAAVQIDALALVGDCVQVLEVKGHHGRVQVSDADHWPIQYADGQWHDLYSPVRQNELHVRAVRANFGGKIPVASTVIFTDAELLDGTDGVVRGVPDWSRGWAAKPTFAVWKKLEALKSNAAEQARLRRLHEDGIRRRAA